MKSQPKYDYRARKSDRGVRGILYLNEKGEKEKIERSEIDDIELMNPSGKNVLELDYERDLGNPEFKEGYLDLTELGRLRKVNREKVGKHA